MTRLTQIGDSGITKRERWRGMSNNHDNPNKNICTLAVTDAFGVSGNVRYLQTVDDVVRAFRTRYTVRSRKSSLGNKLTVGAVRAKLAQMTYTESCGIVKAYLLRLKYGKVGHVILLGRDGSTLIDTDSRKRDKRQITECFVILDNPYK